MIPNGRKPMGNFRMRQVADKGEEADGCEEANESSMA